MAQTLQKMREAAVGLRGRRGRMAWLVAARLPLSQGLRVVTMLRAEVARVGREWLVVVGR